jgi:hypothetical protein
MRTVTSAVAPRLHLGGHLRVCGSRGLADGPRRTCGAPWFRGHPAPLLEYAGAGDRSKSRTTDGGNYRCGLPHGRRTIRMGSQTLAARMGGGI